MSDPTSVLGRVPAGSLSQLSSREVRVVALPPRLPSWPRLEALVLRDAQGVPRAYLNRCRHLPIPIDGASREFLTADAQLIECRTHGARFRLNDGMCVAGPCEGLALLHIELIVEGDELFLIAAGAGSAGSAAG
jgi:nitrite reductase/ring-hydroxylating ferredoxin subunit